MNLDDFNFEECYERVKPALDSVIPMEDNLTIRYMILDQMQKDMPWFVSPDKDALWEPGTSSALDDIRNILRNIHREQNGSS